MLMEINYEMIIKYLSPSKAVKKSKTEIKCFDKYDLDKSHVFGATITKVMRTKDYLEVWGTGKEIRDFLYAEDLVDFIKKAIQKQKTQYEIYNCGSGEPVTVKELCKKIIKIQMTQN